MSDALPQFVRSIPKHWIVLGLLVVAQAGLGAFLNGRLNIITTADLGAPLTIGLLFSQPILLAFWAAFAPQPLYQRFLWSFLLCTVVSFVEEVPALANTHNVFKNTMTIFLAGFIVVTIVCLGFRWIFRWQIKHSLIEDAESDYERSQFGVKHLIILITITAICCGLARSLFIIDPNSQWVHTISEYIGRIYGTLLLIGPVIVIPWIAMTHRPKVLRSLFAIIGAEIVCAVSGGFIISVCFSLPSLGTVFVGEGGVILLIQVGAALSILVTSLVMRFCGFRLVRVPKTAR
jgi:hypothetical protein